MYLNHINLGVVVKMNLKEHKERHIQLHKSLDELCGDYIRHTEMLLSDVSLMDLIEWSHLQTLNPSFLSENIEEKE